MLSAANLALFAHVIYITHLFRVSFLIITCTHWNVAELEVDKKQIETLTREISLLQRSFEQQLRREVQNLSAALQNPNALQQAQVASTLELQEARAHIRELEAQLERTANALREKERQARRSQSGASGGADAKSEQWKMLDVQREKVRVARALERLECFLLARARFALQRPQPTQRPSQLAGGAAARSHSAERVARGGEEARGGSRVAHHSARARAQPDVGGAEQSARVARAAHGRTREEDRGAHVGRHAAAPQRYERSYARCPMRIS